MDINSDYIMKLCGDLHELADRPNNFMNEYDFILNFAILLNNDLKNKKIKFNLWAEYYYPNNKSRLDLRLVYLNKDKENEIIFEFKYVFFEPKEYNSRSYVKKAYYKKFLEKNINADLVKLTSFSANTTKMFQITLTNFKDLDNPMQDMATLHNFSIKRNKFGLNMTNYQFTNLENEDGMDLIDQMHADAVEKALVKFQSYKKKFKAPMKILIDLFKKDKKSKEDFVGDILKLKFDEMKDTWEEQVEFTVKFFESLKKEIGKETYTVEFNTTHVFVFEK